MTWIDRLHMFSALDYAAILLLLLGWAWIGWRIENPPAARPSVSGLMADFRRDWMRQMVMRDPRIFDAQLVANLRQGTAFFASATMIALGGGMALIANPEEVAGLASELTLDDAPRIVWEIKLLVTLLLLASAFLKFVWAHRLFGYCSVLMAAVPNDPGAKLAYPRAGQAAEINITAARSFNRGLRTTYFSLASSAWLLGPEALIAAALFTLAMLYRREFSSQSRGVLLQVPPDTGS